MDAIVPFCIMVFTEGRGEEDRQVKGLDALKELEAFDFGPNPKPEETKPTKGGGLSISIARQKPALKRKAEEQILEIVDSSEEEGDDVSREGEEVKEQKKERN